MIESIFILLFGACIGSFLNVCIYRIPLKRSIFYPRSHCATCGAPIPWGNNIPILSWFILRGKTACCRTKIDPRYCVVEVLAAAGIWALWQVYPPVLAIIYSLFLCNLIVISFIDLDHFIIPDQLSLGGMIVAVVLSACVPQLHDTKSVWVALLHSVFGLLMGGGILLVIALIGTFLLRKEAMGMGDIKLLAFMGALLGWQAPLLIVAVSSVIGSIVGGFWLIRKGRMWGVRMPYGPHLALAGIIWLFGGKTWMTHYLSQW